VYPEDILVSEAVLPAIEFVAIPTHTSMDGVRNRNIFVQLKPGVPSMVAPFLGSWLHG
jgi:hypothetical protein